MKKPYARQKDIRKTSGLALVLAVAALTGCGDNAGDRALSGAGIGAGAGAATGLVLGNPVAGAVLGGAAGAAVGGLSKNKDINLGKPIWR